MSLVAATLSRRPGGTRLARFGSDPTSRHHPIPWSATLKDAAGVLSVAVTGPIDGIHSVLSGRLRFAA